MKLLIFESNEEILHICVSWMGEKLKITVLGSLNVILHIDYHNHFVLFVEICPIITISS